MRKHGQRFKNVVRALLFSKWVFVAVVLGTVAFDSWEACARVGGGQSYRGGGRSGGGGGGGYSGGGFSSGGTYGGSSSADAGFILDLIVLFVRLHFIMPPVALFIDAIIIGFLFLIFRSSKSREYTFVSAAPRKVVSKRGLSVYDPQFSEVLFLDFCNVLFSKFHELRGSKKLENISGYIEKSLLDTAAAASRNVTDVKGVIVGALQLSTPQVTSAEVSLDVYFDANYTELRKDGSEHGIYAKELWTFVRKRGVLSKPPEDVTRLACPACGSAEERNPDGSCPACGTVVKTGSFDWFVVRRTEEEVSEVGPLLTGNVEERGTELPTLFSPDLHQNEERLQREHPEFSWDTFEKRMRHIFFELQGAWSSQNWEKARPYETDSLFQTHYYWIREYKKQGLRNILDDIQLEKYAVARIAFDAWYESITVRLFASMKDYTMHVASGKVVAGSRHLRRDFSEYWTFVRKKGVASGEKDPAACPSCGAPLHISMSGVCDYCHSKITSGKFDWVLSRIEQDEDYG